MAFNPVQFGDWSTRLRRALGLRGDLGFQLAGPAAQPVVVMHDMDKAPYGDVPEHWALGYNIAAFGAGTYSDALLNGVTGKFVVLDRLFVSTSCIAQVYRATAQPALANSALKLATTVNAPAQLTSANATVSQVNALVGSGSASIGSAGFCFYGELYVDMYGPVVLQPGDWLHLQTLAQNTALTFGMIGRAYPSVL